MSTLTSFCVTKILMHKKINSVKTLRCKVGANANSLYLVSNVNKELPVRIAWTNNTKTKLWLVSNEHAQNFLAYLVRARVHIQHTTKLFVV